MSEPMSAKKLAVWRENASVSGNWSNVAILQLLDEIDRLSAERETGVSDGA